MANAGSAAWESRDMVAESAPSQAIEAAPVTRSGLDLTIQVLETATGLRDIEACLGRFNARIRERPS